MDVNGKTPTKEYHELHESIDWSRMARPQADGYDSRMLAALARLLYDVDVDARPAPVGPSMFGGRVPLLHFEAMPSSELQNAPLDHPFVAKAEGILGLWPEMVEQCGRLLTSVRPLKSTRQPDDVDHGAGCSCGNTTRFGGIETTVYGSLGFAEGTVHELGHWKLHACGVHLEEWTHLVANDPGELFESPIRKDKPRPMGACVQAQYSYLHVLELNVIAQNAGVFAGMLRLNRDRMAAGREVLKQWRPTPTSGEAYRAALDSWCGELLERADAAIALQGS